MNPKARQKLNEILKKAKTGKLLDHELAFLRARKPYLKKSQLEMCKGFLKISKSEVKRKAKQVKLDVESKELDADEMNRTAHPAIKKEQVSYRELQAEAKNLKLPYVGICRKDLEKSIIKAKPLKKDSKDGKDKEK